MKHKLLWQTLAAGQKECGSEERGRDGLVAFVRG